jgi:hypothetical protein
LVDIGTITDETTEMTCDGANCNPVQENCPVTEVIGWGAAKGAGVRRER